MTMFPVRTRLANNPVYLSAHEGIGLMDWSALYDMVKRSQEEAARQRAAQKAWEKDVTNADVAIGTHDPAFLAARRQFTEADQTYQKVIHTAPGPRLCTKPRLVGDGLNKDVQQQMNSFLVRAATWAPGSVTEDIIAPEIAKGRAACDAWYDQRDDRAKATADREKALELLKAASKAALEKLAAYYPYKGYIIKPKLSPNYQAIQFTMHDPDNLQVGEADRIEEAKAFIDRKISEQQKRDLEIYDEARSGAVQSSLKVQKEFLKQSIQKNIENLQRQTAEKRAMQEEAEDKNKKTRNLLLIGGAAAGALLLLR